MFYILGLQPFFDLPHKKCILRKLRKDITAIRDFFNDQHQLQFFASSLLIVVEGEQDGPCTGDECDHADRLSSVHMIDFAHAFFVQNEKDENYLFAINNLIKYFEQLGSTF